jgi:hypothetical protein
MTPPLSVVNGVLNRISSTRCSSKLKTPLFLFMPPKIEDCL